MRAYLIPGYGIPKDIEADDNYRRYLGVIFNSILSDQERGGGALIIFSGGRSDCFKPYKRTEAAEMKRLFTKWSLRPFCRTMTKNWKYAVENRSLSTLDNFLFSKDIIRSYRVQDVAIFCEMTRAKRVAQLARRILKGIRARVVPIDFDLSSNRYLDKDFLKNKEQAVAKIEDRSLRDPKILMRYRRAMTEKIQYLRRLGNKNQAASIKKWWETKLAQLNIE